MRKRESSSSGSGQATSASVDIQSFGCARPLLGRQQRQQGGERIDRKALARPADAASRPAARNESPDLGAAIDLAAFRRDDLHAKVVKLETVVRRSLIASSRGSWGRVAWLASARHANKRQGWEIQQRAGCEVSPGDESGPLLAVEGVSKHFGGMRAVDGVSLAIARGEIVGLIGPNGAGKTTMFNLIAGSLKPSRGRSCSAVARSKRRRPIPASPSASAALSRFRARSRA